MIELKEIQSFIQQVADALAAVLDYEVSIIDNELEVVAGTGRYRKKMSTRYGPGSMSHRFLLNPERRVYFIEDSKASDLCKSCEDRQDCSVRAIIACPIIFSKNTLGTIALMAFSKEQQKKLINNSSKLMDFLQKVANLIASTLGEKEMRRQKGIMSHKFKAVINSVHEGIIAIDSRNIITHVNRSAQQNLDVKQQLVGEHINKLFSELDLNQIINDMLDNDYDYFEEKIKYKQKNEEINLICNFTLIKDENKNEVAGVTISFRKLDEMKRLANKIITKDKGFAFDKIKGTSNEIIEIKKRMQRVACTDSTILIRGESGTGKSMFARAIHEESDRSDKAFIEVNCAAIPENLLESELFGYEEGAFTGAKKGGKPGKFELAHKGTIFLDEIGDMPTHFQVKLLKVIENKKIERVGGVESFDVDVRIIAATHQNLEEMVEEGQFRKDLFYRLNVIPFCIPALRKRKEDTSLLLHFFLKEYSELLNKKIRGFTERAEKKLLNYPWPGNVRELENTIEYAVNLEISNYITETSLPERIRKYQSQVKEDSRFPTIDEVEKRTIVRALREFTDKKSVANVLGISRSTLYRKMKKFEINM